MCIESILLILFALIFTLISLIVLYKVINDGVTDVSGYGLGITTTLSIVLIVASIWSVVVNFKHYRYKLNDIISMNVESDQFTMGVGTHGNTSYYYLFYKADNGYGINSIDCEYTTIYTINEEYSVPCIYVRKDSGKLQNNYEIYLPPQVSIIPFKGY